MCPLPHTNSVIYRRGGVYWSKFKRSGVVHRRSLEVTRKVDAQRLDTVLKMRIAEGKLGLVHPPTFEEFCTDFLNYVCKRVKPETYRAYTNAALTLKNFPDIGNARLDLITAEMLDRFVHQCSEKGNAIATINLRLRVARRMLHLAAERGLITKVPRIHGLTGENQREYVISETDEQRLIDTVGHPTMKVLLPFLIDTGLRISEAVALTWADVTDTSVSVKEGKTKFARRTVPLTKRAAEILDGLRSREGFESPGVRTMPDARKLAVTSQTQGASVSQTAPVFTRQFGAIGATWATQHFIKARRKIGLPDGCVLHSTRHTFCSRLGKAGASPFELQRLAGHSNIQISARYCHPDTEQLTSAINRLNKGEK